MKLTSAHVVGISNSGFEMFAVALERPDIVKTLTWVGVGPFRADVIERPSPEGEGFWVD